MSDNFQSVIIEDILELIKRRTCLKCNAKLTLIKNIGGFEHGSNNHFDLEWPICKGCWEKHLIEFEDSEHSSLEEITNSANANLTETVSLLEIVDEEDQPINLNEDAEVNPVSCQHEFRPISTNRLKCSKCYKRVSIINE